MKKILITAVLVLAMILGTLPVYGASGAFTDISDKDTAVAAEVLRLMGVVEGNGNGRFNPNGTFTRAQFSKMAIHLMLKEKEIDKYSTITIFPDAAPNHWAYRYINYAAKTEPRIISGYPSGVFKPDQAIKADEAATILLRILGYDDSSLIWPMGVMDKAEEIGLLDGTGIKRTDAENSITRSQAARLFVRALSTKGADGNTLYTIGERTTLRSIDGSKASIKLSDGTSTPLYSDISSTTLAGSQGRLVTSGGKALTFIPETTVTAGIGGAAVIIGEDRSTAGLSAIAGSSNYKIYKNGQLITANDLKKYDVCIYSSATNSILVCDTRISVFYENCTPSPSAPTNITVLGGQDFSLLDSAVSTVAQYKPGDSFTLLLTPDGQVASVSKDVKGNAIGIYNENGLNLFLGDELLPLSGNLAEHKCDKQIVGITQYKTGEISIHPLTAGSHSVLDLKNRTVGGHAFSENIKFYNYGQPVEEEDLSDLLRYDEVSYVHRNWEEKADVVQLNAGEKQGHYYGRAKVYTNDFGDKTVVIDTGKADDPSVLKSGVDSSYSFKTGRYYYVRLNSQNTFSFIDEMGKLVKVNKSSMIGKSAVTFGANTYEIAEGIMCYVPSSGSWLDLDAALAYSDVFNMYTYNGVIQVLEVAE